MTNNIDIPDEDDDTAKRHSAGLCPYCGGPIIEWTSLSYVTYEPQEIGEGVRLCGRCIGNTHHETEGVVQFILRQIMSARSRAT